jgi:hypothetical protein
MAASNGSTSGFFKGERPVDHAPDRTFTASPLATAVLPSRRSLHARAAARPDHDLKRDVIVAREERK